MVYVIGCTSQLTIQYLSEYCGINQILRGQFAWIVGYFAHLWIGRFSVSVRKLTLSKFCFRRVCKFDGDSYPRIPQKLSKQKLTNPPYTKIKTEVIILFVD